VTPPSLPRSLPPTTHHASLAGLGIAIVNDFKSIEGDRAMGLQSLPVAFGIDAAKWICVGTIDVTQVSRFRTSVFFGISSGFCRGECGCISGLGDVGVL